MRDLLGKNYDKFKKSELYQDLKKIRVIRKLKLIIFKILWRMFPAKYKLHDDPVLQKVFVLLGKEIKASSIVETGTFMGYSTSFMADNFPHKPIFTSEINPINYKKAVKNLSKYKNVKVFLGTSPKFLIDLINNNSIGDTPLFFLDAHWLNDWPLEEEIEIITRKVKRSVILIDDFKIPNRNNFYYDKYGKKECNFELIKPKMNKKATYNLLIPNYGEEIYNGKSHPLMSGYPIIFVNMKKEFEEFKKIDFVKKYFVDSTLLLK